MATQVEVSTAECSHPSRNGRVTSQGRRSGGALTTVRQLPRGLPPYAGLATSRCCCSRPRWLGQPRGARAVTAVAMFVLAAGKARTGRALDNPVLRTEGRVTMIDGILAAAVLLGLVLNAGFGWWWADPAAGYVLIYYAAREVREIFSAHSQ